jgi:lipid II:glycine glycyltransferase (peptidoglycan interpeptide bridge formation enzyme)
MPLICRRFDDEAAWDAFVNAHPHGHLLQRWPWGALKAQYGWKPVRVAVLDGAQLVAGAQILFRPLPMRMGAMGYVPKGPVIAPDSAHWPDLLAAMQQAARAERASFLRLEPEWELGHAPALSALCLQPDEAIVQAPASIMLDLRPAPDDILAQMKPKWRYNIRLAERKQIDVRMGTAGDLPIFQRLSEITSQRDGFPVRSEAYYRAAYGLFKPSDSVALFIAEYQGKPLGSIMVFTSGRMGIYLYGASSDEERNRMPNHLLQWRAMQWCKERGCERYDLWGVPDLGEASGEEAGELDADGSGASRNHQSPITHQPSVRATKLPVGLLRFKEGFGGRLIRYAGAFDIIYQPLLHRGLNWLIEERRKRRREPVSE